MTLTGNSIFTASVNMGFLVNIESDFGAFDGRSGFIVTSYISNARRVDLILALREMADKLEAGQDMPPIRPGEPSA